MHSDVPVATDQRAVTGSGVTGSGGTGIGVTGTGVTGAGVTGSADPADWVGGTRRWDAYYLAILALTLLIAMIEGPAQLGSRLLAAGALLAMVPWYVLVGRP